MIFPFALLMVTLKSNDLEPILVFFRDTGWDEIVAIGRGSFSGKIGEYFFISDSIAGFELLCRLVERQVSWNKRFCVLYAAGWKPNCNLHLPSVCSGRHSEYARY